MARLPLHYCQRFGRRRPRKCPQHYVRRKVLEQTADAKLIPYGCHRENSETQIGKSRFAKTPAYSSSKEIGRAWRHWINRGVQIRGACKSSGQTRSRRFCGDDTRRDRIHFTAHTSNALQKSGDDELLRRKRKLATWPH